MSVALSFEVPGRDLILGRALDEGGMRAELDRVIPVGSDCLPFIWVYAQHEEGYGGFERALEGSEHTESIRCLDEFDDRRLYRFTWEQIPEPIFAGLESTNAALLDAKGDHETWEFEMRFPTQDALTDFHDRCRDAGVDLTVTGIASFTPNDSDSGLSESQRETLVRALEAGLYNVPRDTTAVEFAEELGISDQSLSERLRRAHATLIENTLR